MIEITNRGAVLQSCPALAKYMHDWQQAEYDEMQEELNEKELNGFRDEMDEIDTQNYTNANIFELVYNLEAENIYCYIVKLPNAIFNLAEAMGWKELSFLLLYKKPWLCQKNEYPPVKTELDYLQSIGVKNTSTDGITATGTELIRVLKSMFWLSRCNASLPYIHFSAPQSHTVLYICKYGYLHIYGYDAAEINKLQQKSTEAGLILYNGQTTDFLEGGAMIGRVA